MIISEEDMCILFFFKCFNEKSNLLALFHCAPKVNRHSDMVKTSCKYIIVFYTSKKQCWLHTESKVLHHTDEYL